MDTPTPPPPPPPHRPPQPAPHAPQRTATNRSAMRVGKLVSLSAGAVVFGLLIWAKLQLVAGVPRTAIAEPETTRPPEASMPSTPDTGR